MSRSLTGEDDFRNLSCGDSDRSHLTNWQGSADDYRFGRLQVKRGRRISRALRRVNGCLTTMIEAIANSKLRRIERELEFPGIRLDPHRNHWVRRISEPTERSQ